MTRPQKAREDKRDFMLRVRLTPAEQKTLLELAEQAGMTPSDFVRVKAIGAKQKIVKATPERAAFVRGLAELGKLGSNINQIARALNRRADSDSLTGITLEQIGYAMQGVKTLANHLRELLHGHPGE